MERYLKYGDLVMLYSTDEPVKFMASRSSQEGDVFFIESQSPILREDISSYPNTCELVFAIYPKQYYEASKQFEKFKMRRREDMDENMNLKKGDILKRRMEVEKESNEKKIQSLHGQPITIGSEVQLFHLYSRSFVKATREKNFFDRHFNNQNDIHQLSTVSKSKYDIPQKSLSNQMNVYSPSSIDLKNSPSASNSQSVPGQITSDSLKDMFSLRLSRQVSSSTHFIIKINPYFNFKKDGEKIQYDECIYFYNPKHNSIIQNQSLYEINNSLDNSNGTNNGDNAASKKKSLFQNQYAHLTQNLQVPFTIEKSKLYKHYCAAHKKNNIQLFGVIFIKNSKYITLPSTYLTKTIPIQNQSISYKKSGTTFNPNSLAKQNPYRENFNNNSNNEQNKPDSRKKMIQLLILQQAEIMREQAGFPSEIPNALMAGQQFQNLLPNQNGDAINLGNQQNVSLSMLNMSSNRNNVEKIYFGDYVRIKHIKRNDKQTTQLISESNLCGFSPALLFINDKPYAYHEQYPTSGIFQIVPVDESYFGQPVEFDKQYYGNANFRLRHVNTSRYVKFNSLENNVMLSETLEKHHSTPKPANLNSNNPKNVNFARNKNSPRWFNRVLGNTPHGSASPSIRRSSVRVNKSQLEGFSNQTNKKDFTFSTQEVAVMQEDLSDWYSENADLQIESGSREEKFLLEHNSFSIKEEKCKKYVKVNLMDQEFIEIFQGNQVEEDDFFKPMFNYMNPLQRKYYTLETSSQNGDFFYFTLCKPSEISDLMILNCFIDQFTKILENPQKFLYIQKFMERTENSLLNLLMWLCNIQPTERGKPSLQDLSQPPVQQKQNIFRENGLIDVFINMIHIIHQEKLLNQKNMEVNAHIFSFVQTLLKLLQNICYKNFANSVYTLQWYFLLKEIILDENVILDIRFDSLINDLFKITDMNVSYQADFDDISSKINYEDYNINALNLILSFCQYNEYRQKDQEEEMVKTIFSKKENIFRRLALKPDRTVCIEIDDSGFEYVIDKNLETNEREIWDYSIGVVNLMVELCKANVSLVIEYVEHFYPFNSLCSIIQNQTLSYSYRATILTLIKESYMRYDFRDSIASKYPDYIKFRQKHLQSKDQKKISELVENRYFMNEQGGDNNFNLKTYISNEIREMNKELKSGQRSDKDLFDLYKLGKIVLQMQLFLVERQLYNLQELQEIKLLIQSLIETLITVYENEYKNAKKDDRQKVGGLFVRRGYTIQSSEQSDWIMSALLCLLQIEYRKQNDLLELLYQSPQTSGFFDSSSNNQIQSEQALDAIQEFAKVSIENDKSEGLAKNLTKLLQFNDIQIKALAVQNIYALYSRHQNFYTSVNIIQPIDAKNFDIYQKFQRIHDQIHHYVINLKYVLSNEIDKKKLYLDELSKVFNELCDELFISQKKIEEEKNNKQSKHNILEKEKSPFEINNDLNSQDEQKLINKSTNKIKGGKEFGIHRYKTDQNLQDMNQQQQQQQQSEESIYYHIWGGYYVDLNRLQKYQNLMANMSYHKKILDLIDFFYGQVSMFKEYDHVKLQISQHCIAILIHFVIKNQSNQELLLSENRLTGMSQENQEKVEKSIAYRIVQNDTAIQQLFFVLLYQIYKNNYAELMNFTSSKSAMRSILQEVMKSLVDKLPGDKTYCIYFLDILKYFFSINGKNITQNILFLVSEISEKYPGFPSKIKTISQIVNHLPHRNFEEDVKEILEKKNESDEDNDNENEEDKANDKFEKKIRIKFEDEACILTIFLRTFKEMVKKSSSQIYTFVRGVFSIKDIKDNLNESQFLYPLKTEYLKFLMETYINSKQVEPKEFIEISEIVNCLARELFHYLDMTQKKHIYSKLVLYTRFKSIFEEKYGYSKSSLVQIPLIESFEVYIIEGIIPTIKGFVDKISLTPSDSDAKLVDILLEGLKRVHEYWEDEEGYWTQQMQEEFTELKNQIGINAKNMTSPLKHRGSRDNIRKNSGKKRTFLGGIFGVSPTKSPEKDQKQLIDFNFSDKQEMLAKKLKNVKDLENELNVIVSAKQSYWKNQEAGQIDRTDAPLSRLKNQKKQQIFNIKLIKREHDLDIDNLISIYIQMKKEKPEEFRKILQSLIDVLTKYTGKKEEAMNIRLYAMKILRKISNYKKDQKISDSIQRDLNAMGFLNFLCDVIVDEDDSKMKLEYILGLNNFMEKANYEIQMSFYKYLQDDSSNKFIRTIQNFLKSNFSQFKNYVKNNIGSNNYKAEEQKNFGKIMDGTQENCIQTMELLRLSCENHFSKMQDFFRVQIDSNNEIKTNSINIVIILADIFEKYYKIMSENNLQFGLQILDTLIEFIQGPCIENQNVLCHTKLLENLEDVIADFNGKSKKFLGSLKNSRIFTRFSRKVFLLLRSLFDANEDPILISKICTYVDPQMLILKMNFTYKQYLQITSKISRKHQGFRKFLKLMKDEGQKEQALIREDKADEDEGDDSSTQKNPSLNKNMNKNSYNKGRQSKKRKDVVVFNYSSDVIKYMKGDELISEGFDSYILLKNLCFLDSSFKKKYHNYVQSIDLNEDKAKEIRQTLNFYKINTVSIEIINSKGNLQKIIFRKPKLMKYFSTISQEDFLDNCERGSAQEKISSLIENLDDFHEEMKHFLFLNSKNLFFNLTYLSWFRNLNLFVILLINIFILYEWDNDTDILNENGDIIGVESHKSASGFKKFLEILQLVMSGLIYLIWLIFQFPLELKKSISNYKDYHEKTFKYKVMRQNDLRQKTDAQKQINKITGFYRQFIFISNHLIFKSHLVYLLVAIIFSVLGITSNPVFFCLLLLDIIDRSVVLRNVIKAITLNSIALVMTAILGIIIVYIFAMIGFYSNDMRDTFQFTGNNENLKVCTDALDCFLVFMNFGIRNGGGISDSLAAVKMGDSTYMQRFFFDLGFFVIIIIMLLNMIFGIIIDTFAELRDIKNFKDNDQKNNCFICNIERSEFENERVNFKKHNEKEHCCWNYIAYMIMLEYKDINEYDGIESYVSEKIAKQDMSWFPIGKSLTLQKRREESNKDGDQKSFNHQNTKNLQHLQDDNDLDQIFSK